MSPSMQVTASPVGAGPGSAAFLSDKEERVNRALGRRLLVSVVLSVLAIGLAATPATAQILYGSVVGVVRDAQGATVPGATVTIVNKDNNLTRETVTNTEGAF